MARVVAAFLAKSAIAHDDGTFSVLGGGVDRLTFPSLPATAPELSLVCKFQFEGSELGVEQTIEIRALDPNGRAFLPLFGLAIVPRPDPEALVSYFHFVYALPSAAFQTQGRHTFVVGSKGHPKAIVDLYIEHAPTATPAPENTLTGALDIGFQSFMRGERAEALSTFRGLVERFPDSPEAHNNLGFTLLASKEVRDALMSFERALQLGPQYPELVQANIGVCKFLLNDYSSAADVFESLIGEPLRAPGCVLFGLGKSSYVPINLLTTADFMALMALNGARASIRADNKERAGLLTDVAKAGQLTLKGPFRAPFVALLHELESDPALLK